MPALLKLRQRFAPLPIACQGNYQLPVGTLAQVVYLQLAARIRLGLIQDALLCFERSQAGQGIERLPLVGGPSGSSPCFKGFGIGEVKIGQKITPVQVYGLRPLILGAIEQPDEIGHIQLDGIGGVDLYRLPVGQ